MNDLNQALQTKFPHLEVSCLKLSEVQKDNETKRIDSEYFKKEYLENEEIISKFKYLTLEELSSKITNGHTPYGENLMNNEIKFITAEFIDDFLIHEVKKFISYESHSNYLKRSILKNGDIIFSIKGKIGNAVPIFDIVEPLNINQDIAKISIKQNINIFYLCAFLNSKYGKKQTQAQSTGQINPFISLNTLKKLKIPLLPMDFQLEIQKLVKDSHFALEQSKGLYKEAQNMLYIELGLNPDNPLQSILDFHPTLKEQDSKLTQKSLKQNLNISIRTLKESLGTSGRLDSEYYQEKYYTMENLIKSKGFKTLEQICSLINYGSVPTSPYSENNEGIPYIKGLNLKNLQIDEDKLDRITNAENLDSKFFTKENDIIISQMGTVGDVGIVSKKQENYIFASFTIRIRLKNTSEFNPYFVGLYIQHIAKEWYLYRNIAQASVRQNTDLPTIKNLYIPLIDTKTQEKIATLIQESFALRAKAKALLDEAKARVENAIKGV